MQDESDQTSKKDVQVRSDLAPPSRPGGYEGVRQPIEPIPPVNPPKNQPDDPDLAR